MVKLILFLISISRAVESSKILLDNTEFMAIGDSRCDRLSGNDDFPMEAGSFYRYCLGSSSSIKMVFPITNNGPYDIPNLIYIYEGINQEVAMNLNSKLYYFSPSFYYLWYKGLYAGLSMYKKIKLMRLSSPTTHCPVPYLLVYFWTGIGKSFRNSNNQSSTIGNLACDDWAPAMEYITEDTNPSSNYTSRYSPSGFCFFDRRDGKRLPSIQFIRSRGYNAITNTTAFLDRSCNLTNSVAADEHVFRGATTETLSANIEKRIISNMVWEGQNLVSNISLGNVDYRDCTPSELYYPSDGVDSVHGSSKIRSCLMNTRRTVEEIEILQENKLEIIKFPNCVLFEDKECALGDYKRRETKEDGVKILNCISSFKKNNTKALLGLNAELASAIEEMKHSGFDKKDNAKNLRSSILWFKTIEEEFVLNCLNINDTDQMPEKKQSGEAGSVWVYVGIGIAALGVIVSVAAFIYDCFLRRKYIRETFMGISEETKTPAKLESIELK